MNSEARTADEVAPRPYLDFYRGWFLAIYDELGFPIVRKSGYFPTSQAAAASTGVPS